MPGRRSDRILRWFRRRLRAATSPNVPARGPRDHVVILDGTMSSLEPGRETNAGRTYRLLCEAAPHVSLFYEAGLQWRDWPSTLDVFMGRGINAKICRAYGFLAARYRPGDRIFLIGYSRGAFAVRSLAGVIDRIGLLRPEHALERNLRQAYRHYRFGPDRAAARAFAERFCHARVEIEAVAVWDTVKALGLRLPMLWRLTERRHIFHDHLLGGHIRHGFHALALDESRAVYEPVMWACPAERADVVEQVWFPGTHGDVGGQLGGFEPARPLANLPLVWMLERLEACGLPLPEGWASRSPADPQAPSVGQWRGGGKLFLLRKRRPVGLDPSERVHDSVRLRRGNLPEHLHDATVS